MISLAEKNAIVEAFENGVKGMYQIVSDKYDVQKYMDEGNAQGVKDAVKGVQNVMIGNIPNGCSIPRLMMHVTPYGDGRVSYFKIKIINSVHSERKFSFDITITRENAFDRIFDFFYEMYYELIVDELVCKNLEKINDVLKQAVANAGVEYDIKVVSDMNSNGKKLLSLMDDEVVFVADTERVFSSEDLIVLLDAPTEEISEAVIQDHFNSLVEEIRLAQTTAQLVGVRGGALVAYVCDIPKRIRSATLIKKSCSKSIDKVNDRDKNGCLAYYLKDDVYAVVSFKEGVPEVVLSPFDINTFVNVDKDILAEVNI